MRVPRVDVLLWRKDCYARIFLFLEEPLQVEELWSDQLILEMSQPTHVQRIDLQLQKLLLLRGERFNPLVLVEFGNRRRRPVRDFNLGFRRTEKRSDAPIALGLLGTIW